MNGLYKTELIGRHGPWRTAWQVELATAAWVDWWNQRRLHGAIGAIPRRRTRPPGANAARRPHDPVA